MQPLPREAESPTVYNSGYVHISRSRLDGEGSHIRRIDSAKWCTGNLQFTFDPTRDPRVSLSSLCGREHKVAKNYPRLQLALMAAYRNAWQLHKGIRIVLCTKKKVSGFMGFQDGPNSVQQRGTTPFERQTSYVKWTEYKLCTKSYSLGLHNSHLMPFFK